MTVDSDDPRPAYEQVAASLRTSIRDGQLKAGDRLPPGRELSEQHGVAMMTVKKAIDVLRREGLVNSQQGRGVFVKSVLPPEPVDVPQLAAQVAELGERVAELERRLNAAEGRAR